MCVSRCGATAAVVGGRFTELGPGPGNPIGRAVCVKGKAPPRIGEHPDRLLHPLRRTTPKGSADRGWEQIASAERTKRAVDTVFGHRPPEPDLDDPKRDEEKLGEDADPGEEDDDDV